MLKPSPIADKMSRQTAPPRGAGFDVRMLESPDVRAPAEVAPQRGLVGAVAFVSTLLARRNDRVAPPLAAAYRDGACLQIDFRTRVVTAEPAAWARLVARGELPLILDGSQCPIDFSVDAERRDLEGLVWAVGLACADLPLLGAPLDWRRARVIGHRWLHVYQYTCTPVHLHLAEVLQRSPATPIELRRATRVREAELRGFLQACLLLGFAQWDDA
jgi:hypothetical protein